MIFVILILISVLVWGFIFFNKTNNKLEKENRELREKNAISETQRTHLEEKIQEDKKLQDSVKSEFKNLANEIFEEKTQRFKKTSKENIENILGPLKTQIEKFEKEVGNKYANEEKERYSLKKEVRNLVTTREALAEETKKLTSALKSDIKKQGVWGEIKLERILEHSGLEEGREYILQGKGMGLKSKEGAQQLPDAIVNLPEEKHIIIDSKVSLKSYWDFINGEDNKEVLENLFSSVRSHIDDLSRKEYQSNSKLTAPEFVVLFFPLEGALSLIMDMNVPNQNKNLLEYAWDKSVVLVTPSNLMATLKTIASLWRHAKLKQTYLEIAKESGNMYDKFVGFLKDLLNIEHHLSKAQDSYESAENKLKTGRGNLISKAKKIKELGATTTKSIPEEFLTDIEHVSSDKE